MSEPMDNKTRQRASRARRKAYSDRRRADGQVKLEVWLDADAAKVMDRLTRGADDKRATTERLINDMITGRPVPDIE